MRHARPDYDLRIQDAADLIPMEEPVLFIRGQDQAAIAAGEAWIEAHLAAGGDRDVAMSVSQHLRRIADWQANHAVKVADLP